ncbi:MAG: homoserine dehydrogenase [Arachnia propionica]|nr:MAG: homoserine dehydrogenase [Arachnia propionica]
MTENAPLRVALLGAGVVGSHVARIILEQGDSLAERIGRRLELIGIGVRRLDVPRPRLPQELLTTDLTGLVNDNDLDLVIEVIGGIEPARSLILAALSNGASVVTANKALLADHLGQLSQVAYENSADLLYEAAVAGAIPILRPLRESLVGDEITAVMGIVNGTTNFILDKMATDGLEFDAALAQAQQLGFAEADPTADIEGFDAAAKAAILAGLAFHTSVSLDQVMREGITAITATDIAAAKELGCVIKLLAVAKLSDDPTPKVIAKVHPAMIPTGHPLAGVPGAFNAIFVESKEAGQLMFLGQGAGGAPTASAIMGDVVTAARNIHRGAQSHLSVGIQSLPMAPIGQSAARFYLRFDVEDRVGVLAKVADIFGRNGVSLQTVNQTNLDNSATRFNARLGVMTHDAIEAGVADVIADLARVQYVGDDIRMIRVEGYS